MRRLTGGLFLSAALIMVGFLAAGCGSSHSGPLASLAPSRTATSLPSRTATSGPSQTPSSPAAAAPVVTPSAAAPTLTVPPSSAAASASGSDSVVIWPWILLGVIVVIGLVVLISRASGRKSKAVVSWQSGVIDAYAKGSALHDAMSVAETPGALAADNAGARWFDIQRRADELAQTLYALREAAPNDADRALVADTLASLQVIRSAMDAERAPAGAGAEQAAVVRNRLASFEAALSALRASSDLR